MIAFQCFGPYETIYNLLFIYLEAHLLPNREFRYNFETKLCTFQKTRTESHHSITECALSIEFRTLPYSRITVLGRGAVFSPELVFQIIFQGMKFIFALPHSNANRTTPEALRLQQYPASVYRTRSSYQPDTTTVLFPTYSADK